MTLETKQVGELTMEDAIALAQQVDRYEQALKLMKDKLKAFVELHGDVTANGKVWHFAQSYSWNFDSQNLKAMAGMMALEGLNPFEYFTISADSLKKLGWSEDMIAQYGDKKPKSKSFKALKVENYQK